MSQIHGFISYIRELVAFYCRIPFSTGLFPNGPAFDPGQMLPATIVRMILFLSLPGQTVARGRLNWDLAVIHDCREYSSVIKLRHGRAMLWNLVEAGGVLILLPMQICPREFVRAKNGPLYHLALKGTRSRQCLFEVFVGFCLGDRQATPAQCVESSKTIECVLAWPDG